jgi:hypothetical protein
LAWRIGNLQEQTIQDELQDVLLIIKTYYWFVSCGIDILFIRPFYVLVAYPHWKRINWYYGWESLC